MMMTPKEKRDDLQKSLIYCEEANITAAAQNNVMPGNSSVHNTSLSSSNCTSCNCSVDDMHGRSSTFHLLYWHVHPNAPHFTTRRKLLFLLFVASLALLSIVLISEQLIARHLGRHKHNDRLIGATFVEEFDILTLEKWAQQDTTVFPHSGVQNKLDGGAHPDSTHLTHSEGLKIVEDGIFWSKELEAQVAPGPSDSEVQAQLQELRQRSVKSVDKPDWLHCGRDQNRFVTFGDNTNGCARYRPAHTEFVQGEVMAFYLARLLGITNTPAVVLSKANSRQWETMQEPDNVSKWPQDAVVALIEWLPNLTKTTMPPILRQMLTSQTTSRPLDVTSIKLKNLDQIDLEHLVQWSDLIIFDYLTGNYDRVASMQDGAEKENRPAILRETVHNLALSETTGSLWLLDNESAFLDAYSLLYDNSKNGQRFREFHRQILQTMCVFRRKTVNRLFALQRSLDPAKLLLRFVSDNEPLFEKLPTIHANSVFRQHFGQRINDVWNWIRQCQLNVHYRD